MALKDLISKIILEDEFSRTFDSYQDELDQSQKSQDKFRAGIGGLTKGFGAASAAAGVLGPVVVAGAGAAAGALALATNETLKFGNETTQAMQLFQQQTGTTNEELDNFKQIALDIFEANWGESIEDVAGAMAQVRNQTGAAGDQLKDLTTSALVLRDRFDKDVNESVDASRVLMDEFGLSSEQAFDFLVAGVQRGLDRNGDLLDSVREYGNLFGDAGFSADEFFSLLESGAAGGVLGTDKIADAVKEFQIRANEGTDAVKEAFGELGLDFETVAGQVASGQATWADFFDQVIAGLNNIDDPIQRSQAQVALFGTQAEDLGASFTKGLSTTTTSLADMTGSLDAAAASSTDLGTLSEEAMRAFQVGVEPVAKELLPILADGIRLAGDFLREARPVFSDFATDLSGTLGPAMVMIEDATIRIANALGIATEDTSGMDLALMALDKTLGVIVTTIQVGALAAQGIASVFEFAEKTTRSLRREVEDLIEAFKEFDLLQGASSAANFTPAGIIANLGGSALGLPGFAGGGSFTVGGNGGIDSQLVAFRATPGEQVTVGANQQTGGHTIIVNNYGVPGGYSGARQTGRSVLDALNGR